MKYLLRVCLSFLFLNSFLSPQDYVLHDLQDSTNSVDYLIVTPDSFLVQSNILAAHHAQKGKLPGIAIWDDIQSLWTDSAPDSNLKEFLRYAWDNWVGAELKFLVLVGDWEIIPPHNTWGCAGPDSMCFNDNWYGTLDSLSEATYLPLFALGRIPVESVEEINRYIQRVIDYDFQIQMLPWQNRIVAITDTSYVGSCIFDGWMETYIENYFEPSELQCVIASLCEQSDYFIADHSELVQFFTQGSVLSIFAGLSCNGQWGLDSLITLENVQELQFWTYSPVIISIATKQWAFRDSLSSVAKMLLTYSGYGPIAVFSTSDDLSYSMGEDYLENQISAILSEDIETIGEALNAAKSNISPYSREYFQLYGDPGIEVQMIRDNNDINENLSLGFSIGQEPAFVTVFPDSEWQLVQLPFYHYRGVFPDSSDSLSILRLDIIPEVVREPYWGGQIFIDDISIGTDLFEDFEDGFAEWDTAGSTWGTVELSLSNNTPTNIGSSLLINFSHSSEDSTGPSLFTTITPPLKISTADTLKFWVKAGEAFLNIKPSKVLPTEFVLYQNYPNPFNPVTTIRFDLPEDADVQLAVYDVLGRVVEELVSGQLVSGKHEVVWDGSDVSSGVYLCQLTTNNLVITRKMVVVK